MSYKFNPFTQQLDYYEAKGLGGSSQITNLSLVFCESFTGDGGTTEFTLTGSLDNVTFSNGSWSLARVGDTLPSHATDENNAALYDSTNIFTKNRIQVDSINGLTGVVTLTEPPQFLEEFKIWYWYDLLSTNVLSFYRREDFVASMEGDISSGDTLPANDIALNISQFDSILSNADTDVQKAMDTLDDHTHVEADITDLAHYTSSDFDTDFSSKNTADLSEVTNLYYTELRVSSNTDVSSNTSARHTHANKTLLDSLISSGPGTNYLADDGTYNSIVVITDFISLTDTPSAYAGTAGQFVRVNATPDGLEFVTLDDVATSGSHTDLSNIGTNTHTQIDTHITDSSIHFTEGSIDHGSISGLLDDDHTQYLLINGTRAMTGDLNLGANDITNIDSILFNLTPTVAHTEGLLHWSDDSKTLELAMSGGNVNLQIGQEFLSRSRNTTVSEIKDGHAVYITGATGNFPEIALADNSYLETACFFGLTTEDISASGYGYVTTDGVVNNIDTSLWTSGDLLWLSNSGTGTYSNVRPDAPAYSVLVGNVIRSSVNEGSIYVRQMSIPKLTYLSDVNVRDTTLTNKDLLWWDLPNERWDRVTLASLNADLDHDTLIGSGTNTHTQIDAHISNTESIYENVQEPSGFKPTLLSDSSLSVAPLTRTFTIAPTGADFEFWVKGVKYIKSVAQDVVFPDIEGIHYFYFDTTGTLATSQVNTDWFNIIAGNGATVSSILWDATNKEAIQISEERHGFMPGTTHILMHLAFGMQWISGGILSDILSDQSGDLDTHAQLGVTSVSVIDEDLLFDYTDGSPQTITSPAQIPVFYLTGASGNWRKKVADDYPFIHSGTAGYTGAGGRAAYNEWTGTVWQLTEVTNNNFFLAHIFATNDISEPIISIQGQNEYNTIIAARAGAQIELDNLHTVGLTSAEFTPIGTVILQTSNSYSNVPQSRIRTTDEGDDYIKWIGNYKYSSGGGGITDHSLLNGLANDDHLQYLLVDGTRAMTGALDMGTNNITNVGTVDGRDISTDGSTLDSHVGSSSNPHSTSIANIGSGTIAQLNSAISDATLDDSSDSRTPTTHATSHQNAGSDEISVIGLSGLLGDPQTPVQHALDSATYHSVPTDITTFNSTAAAHGFLPKLSGVSSEFLNGAGDWATPPGEVNTTSNIGLGYWMAKSKVGVDLPFRSIAAGDNIIIDSNPNDITINARPTSEYVAEVWRGESKAEIVNGVGLLCKVAIDQANPPGGVPLTGTGLDHIDGLIAPYTTTTTVNIVKIHILVARCATDTGTVGTAPTIRLDIYSHTNTSRTLLETVRVPVTTGVSSIATNDSLAGTGNYIIFSVDLTASAIGIVQNSLIGFEFVNESGEDAINSLSRPTVSMNVQSGALAP